MGFSSGIRSCGQNLCSVHSSPQQEGQRGTGSSLVVCTLLASELWQDHCPSWGGFCPGLLGEGSDSQLGCS